MKTVCRTISFAPLPIVAIAAMLCFQACPRQQMAADKNDSKLNLKIGDREKNHWVDVNQPAFDAALTNLPKDAEWKISFLCNEGATPEDDYNPGDPNHHPMCIKTDKVTKSDFADSAAAGASVANDPNATQHIRVQRARDLKAVLDAFAEPSPTPPSTP